MPDGELAAFVRKRPMDGKKKFQGQNTGTRGPGGNGPKQERGQFATKEI